MRVLIVDDNASNRRILEETTRARGMKPLMACSAQEAIAILQNAKAAGTEIPLILSDVNMPDVDGFMMVSQLRNDIDLGDVVVIMLTSGVRSTDRARCEELGVAAHLMKPVKQSELFDAIVVACGITSVESADRAGETVASGDLPSLRILLAEDAVANQVLAIGLLEKKWKHHVTVANNGRQAIDHLSKESFDVVLMDVQMPELDGLEATTLIRQMEADNTLPTQQHSPIPIIAMTAHAMKGDRERCLDAGMDDYVSKPIRADDLQRALNKCCLPEEPTVNSSVSVSGESPVTQSDAARVEAVVWSEALKSVQDDEELLRRVVDAFLSECPGHLEQLNTAIHNKDATVANRLAHTIRGSLRMLAARDVESIAEDLESSTRADEWTTAFGHYKRLSKEMPDLIVVLTDFVEGRIKLS